MEDGITPLHVACGFGSTPDLQKARQLVSESLDAVNSPSWEESWTPLHIASIYGSLEIVELLLQRKADPNAKSVNGMRALDFAAREGHQRILECLISATKESGISEQCIASHQTHSGNTVFHFAATAARLGGLKILLAMFGLGHLEARTQSGVTPLLAACGADGVDFVEPVWTDERANAVLFLLAEGADPLVQDVEGKTALHLLSCFANGSTSICATLLEKGVDINAKTTTDLNATAGVESSSGYTALHFASRNWIEDIVQFLLSKGADPKGKDTYARTPLHLASSNWQDQNSGPFEFDGGKALATARAILEYAPDIDAKDKMGNTPLLNAAKSIGMMYPTLQLLYQQGADIKAINHNGQNAIHLATLAKIGSSSPYLPSESIPYLIKNGVSISTTDKWYTTPLYRAAASGLVEAVEVLLQNGADVNTRMMTNGRTALHAAYEKGWENTTGRVLLEHGADIEIRDNGARKAASLMPTLVPQQGVGRGRGRG